jgi:hypothetical protein
MFGWRVGNQTLRELQLSCDTGQALAAAATGRTRSGCADGPCTRNTAQYGGQRRDVAGCGNTSTWSRPAVSRGFFHHCVIHAQIAVLAPSPDPADEPQDQTVRRPGQHAQEAVQRTMRPGRTGLSPGGPPFRGRREPSEPPTRTSASCAPARRTRS